jgi:Tol biopolymer transport system component/uncharacterized protein YjdB
LMVDPAGGARRVNHQPDASPEHTTMTTILEHARRTARAAATLALLVAAACDGSSGNGPDSDGGSQRPAVASVSVAPGAPALAIGESAELSAEPRDATGRPLTDRSVTWSSTNDAVATVSSAGVVTAVGAGTARVVAASEGKQGTAEITVAASRVVRVELNPRERSLAPGGQFTITATATDAAGGVVTGRPVTWTTTDAQVATVAADGRVTGVAPGDVHVAAEVDGKRAEAFVHVRAPTIARIAIDQLDADIPMDVERQLTVTAYDADGNTVPVPVVQWQSSDPSVLSVTPAGRIAAIQPGSAEITATALGHHTNASFFVPAHEWTHDLVYLGPNTQGQGPAQIRIQPLDGRAPTALDLPGIHDFATIDDVAPSPDGTRIAFTATSVSAGEIRMDLWVVHRDGSGLRRLTTDVDAWEEQPAWSPDGQKIAFRSTQGGVDSDIWVMNADGSAPQNLTAGAGGDHMNEEWPAWSPDGARIAYGALVRPTGHGEIWTMAADGSGKQRLTSNTSVYDWEPAWSPDGTKLAFIRVGAPGSADVTILDVAGPTAGLTTRIPIGVSQLSPSWSPDGRYLAFTSNHGGRWELYTVRPDGRGLKKRTESVVPGAFEPGWLRR